MALIKCAECGREISNTAVTCIGCGAPIAAQKEVRAIGKATTTTELTSKHLKLHLLFAMLVMIVGVIWMAGADSDSMTLPILVTLVGFVWAIVTRIRVWWHHD